MIREHRGGTTPYVELAKYEEHVRRNIPAALELTEKAMAICCEPGIRDSGTVQQVQNELQYRYQRLRRKMKEQ